MKKGILPLIIIITFITAFGVKVSSAYEILDPGSWKDGTYIERSRGKYGEFDVKVIIENGKIKDVLVGNHKELSERGGIAIQELPPQIVDKQSCEIDGISGATITSDALKDAVERCLEEASVCN